MRVIKFRFYDQFNSTYHYLESYGDLSHFFLAYHAASEAGNNPILEQFTGLHDKNGKDIYEGDIVKATSDEYYSNESFTMDELDFTGQVEFNSAMWCLSEYENGSCSSWMPMCDCLCGDFELEIIGNIRSNPELLEANP